MWTTACQSYFHFEALLLSFDSCGFIVSSALHVLILVYSHDPLSVVLPKGDLIYIFYLI
jgi:hypothetical protein